MSSVLYFLLGAGDQLTFTCYISTKLLSQFVHATDVATKLLKIYPEELVVARYDKQTALHMLARKTSEEFC